MNHFHLSWIFYTFDCIPISVVSCIVKYDTPISCIASAAGLIYVNSFHPLSSSACVHVHTMCTYLFPLMRIQHAFDEVDSDPKYMNIFVHKCATRFFAIFIEWMNPSLLLLHLLMPPRHLHQPSSVGQTHLLPPLLQLDLACMGWCTLVHWHGFSPWRCKCTSWHIFDPPRLAQGTCTHPVHS